MGSNTLSNKTTSEKLAVIISIFIVAQPFIDVITSLCTRAGFSLTFGVVVRTIFMLICFVYVLFIAKFDKKKLCCTYIIAITAYCAIFLAYFLLTGGLSMAIGNLKELIKIFYFSYVLTAFYAIYKEHKYIVSDKIMAFTVFGYMLVIFVAFATGTSFESYKWGFGYNGWFYAANEIGAIVSILVPFAVFYFSGMFGKNPNKKISLFFAAIALLLCCFCSTFVGTKVVFIGIFGYIFCCLVWSLIQWLRKKEKSYFSRAIISLVMCALILCSYTVSPLKKNIDGVMAPGYEEIMDEINPDDPGESEIPEFTWQYKVYRVANWLLSNRLFMIRHVTSAYFNGKTITKIIGIGYVTSPGAEHEIDKTVEIDPLAVLYRHGILGFILFYIPFIYALFMFLIAFFRHPLKRLQSLKFCSYFYSFLLACFISLCAGHTLVAPAVSIFVAIIIIKLIDTIKTSENIDAQV